MDVAITGRGTMNGSTTVPIPDSLRGTIRDIIKEIAGKYSEEDVYAVLKDCNMDPIKTTQKLLYIDTFQEVKSKRDLRKMSANCRASKEHRQLIGKQRSSNYYSNSSSGRQQPNARQDNGSSRVSRSRKQVIHKESDKASAVASSEVLSHDSTNACNRSSNRELLSQSAKCSMSGATNDKKSDCDNKPAKSSLLRPVTVKHLQDIDPGPTPTSTPTNPSTPATSRCRSLRWRTHLGNSNGSTPVSGVYSSALDPILVPSLNPRNPCSAGIIKREKNLCDAVKNLEIGQVMLGSFDFAGCIQLNDQDACSSQLGNEPSEGMVSAGVASGDNQAPAQLCVGQHKLHISSRQSVIFPSHLRVPVPKGLTFGSLFDPSVEQNNEDSRPKDASGPTNSTESFEKSSPVPEFSSQASAHDNYNEQPVSTAPENIPPIGRSHNSLLTPTLEYSANLVPPAVDSHLMQLPELEQQGGSSLLTAGGTAPSPTQSEGVTQGSVAVPPQMFPFFRQPYPSNYVPYNPYYSQLFNYMLPQNTHQLMGQGGFTHQPAPSPIYVSETASGGKLPFPAVYNPGNITHFGNFSGYGSYGGLGYGSSSILPAASQEDDSLGSELKEQNLHSDIKQDTSGLQANAYHLSQGQPMAFPPAQAAGHNLFATIYHPSQSMTAESQPAGLNPESIVSYPQYQQQYVEPKPNR